MAITEKVHKKFQLIVDALDTEKTHKEIVSITGLSSSNVSAYLTALCKLKILARHDRKVFPKLFTYSRKCEVVPLNTESTRMTSNGIAGDSLDTQPVNPNLRSISFSTKDMITKLGSQDALFRKERSRIRVTIGSTFNMV